MCSLLITRHFSCHLVTFIRYCSIAQTKQARRTVYWRINVTTTLLLASPDSLHGELVRLWRLNTPWLNFPNVKNEKLFPATDKKSLVICIQICIVPWWYGQNNANLKSVALGLPEAQPVCRGAVRHVAASGDQTQCIARTFLLPICHCKTANVLQVFTSSGATYPKSMFPSVFSNRTAMYLRFFHKMAVKAISSSHVRRKLCCSSDIYFCLDYHYPTHSGSWLISGNTFASCVIFVIATACCRHHC